MKTASARGSCNTRLLRLTERRFMIFQRLVPPWDPLLASPEFTFTESDGA
jgi:hypothetical protein